MNTNLHEYLNIFRVFSCSFAADFQLSGSRFRRRDSFVSDLAEHRFRAL